MTKVPVGKRKRENKKLKSGESKKKREEKKRRTAVAKRKGVGFYLSSLLCLFILSHPPLRLAEKELELLCRRGRRGRERERREQKKKKRSSRTLYRVDFSITFTFSAISFVSALSFYSMHRD